MPKRRLALWMMGFVVYVAVLMAASALMWCLLGLGPSEGWDTWRSATVGLFPWFNDGAWLRLGILPGLFIAITQYLFLLPVRQVRVGLQPRARPLLRGLVGAAFVGAMGMTALLLSLTDVVWLIARSEAYEYDDGYWGLFSLVLGVLVCSWLIWTPLLAWFCRRRPQLTTPGRLVGLLLGGTIAELVVIIPVDVLVRTRNSCYCATASFHATWLATLALLWLAGPGILLAVTSRRRRAWLESHCDNCGYPKGPSPGAECPECGYKWGDATSHRP